MGKRRVQLDAASGDPARGMFERAVSSDTYVKAGLHQGRKNPRPQGSAGTPTKGRKLSKQRKRLEVRRKAAAEGNGRKLPGSMNRHKSVSTKSA